MKDDETARDELEGLLPFYLNGTLDGDELGRVERWLSSDPAASSALAEAEAEYSATLEANEAVRPPADALSRFSAALEREAGPERKPATTGLLVRAWQGLVGLPAGLAWAAACLAIAFALGQAVLDGGAPGDYEIAGDDQPGAGPPFVLVTFAPEASIGAVSAALDGFGVSIIGGPLPGGMYRVAIPVTDLAAFDRIAADIAASDLVGQVVNGRKPADE